MEFKATKRKVLNRGVPPNSFLLETVLWARTMPLELFAPNPEPADIYAQIRPILGPWRSVEHRRAVMLEVMRVHAGFESSWTWSEGVDHTNKSSMRNITGQETGIFQVSFDSTWLGGHRMLPFAAAHGIQQPELFIPRMKSDHALALEYYARLIRFNVTWAGPIKRHEIDTWLSKDAVAEFQSLVAVDGFISTA